MILYHGTGHRFAQFNPYTFFTDSYAVAQQYAANKFGYQEFVRVIQVDVDLGDVVHIPAECLALFQGRENGNLSFIRTDEDIKLWMDSWGADSAVVHDLEDIGGRPTQYLVRDPSRIRMLNEVVASLPLHEWLPNGDHFKHQQIMLYSADCPF